MSTPNLLDAVRVVKENERNAAVSYEEASQKISNPMGKKLFEQLSEFEKFHYEQLSRLEASLEKDGKYIDYKGKEFPAPPVFEIKAVQEQNTKSAMTIITAAIDLEKQAEKAYGDLALQTDDPLGFKMFTRLAEEEHNHYRILINAYWTMTNLNFWKWTAP